ncbi:MAG: hypothetical protein GF401_10850 [Chitinivibrionales bacterium]|nr:hypothetical protein [Chitinivibrionales bacterium]
MLCLLLISSSKIHAQTTASFERDTAHTDSAADTLHDISTAEDKLTATTDSAASSDTAVTMGQPPNDSLRKQHTQTRLDSLKADSLRKAALKDSLLEMNAYYKGLYARFPEYVDSFYNPSHFYTWQLFNTDGSGISEALRFSPMAISTRFSLSSSLNRFLYYGFPSGFGAPVPETGIFPIGFDPVDGTDFFSNAEASRINFGGPGDNTIELHPYNITTPEMSIFWENGVFSENILDIRFARPLASNLQLGVFSSYRFLAHDEYSHRPGDIYNFFKNSYDFFGADTSAVANKGTNPLTDELAIGIHLEQYKDRDAKNYFTYEYSDIKDELLYQQQNSTMPSDTAPLLWERLTQYRNDIRFGMTGLGRGPLRGDMQLSVDRDVNKRHPLSGIYWDGSRKRQGALTRIGCLLKPYLLLGNDTLFADYLFDNSKKILYTNDRWHSTGHRTKTGYVHPFQMGTIQGLVKGSAGHRFLTIEDSSGHVWTWDAKVQGEVFNHTLNLFAQQDANPYEIPYDVSEKISGLVFDTYRAFGAEAFFAGKKLGLAVGYAYLDGIDSATVKHSWPHGIAPYEQPQSVFTIAPVFGKWHGLTFSSRWMISDTKPYTKSQTALTWDIVARGGRQHIILDLALDYWSERGDIRLGSPENRDIWSREIYDLYFKTTVHIKSFRLFYKIDNLLNRQIAYVPGYIMPGITFRWGFSWLIKG